MSESPESELSDEELDLATGGAAVRPGPVIRGDLPITPQPSDKWFGAQSAEPPTSGSYYTE